MLRPYVACLPSLSLHRQDRHPLDRFAGTLRVEIERAQRLDLVSPPLEPRRCRHPKSIHVEDPAPRSEEHTSELQSQSNLVCRLLLEKKKRIKTLVTHKNNWATAASPCRDSSWSVSIDIILLDRHKPISCTVLQVHQPIFAVTRPLC